MCRLLSIVSRLTQNAKILSDPSGSGHARMPYGNEAEISSIIDWIVLGIRIAQPTMQAGAIAVQSIRASGYRWGNRPGRQTTGFRGMQLAHRGEIWRPNRHCRPNQGWLPTSERPAPRMLDWVGGFMGYLTDSIDKIDAFVGRSVPTAARLPVVSPKPASVLRQALPSQGPTSAPDLLTIEPRNVTLNALE